MKIDVLEFANQIRKLGLSNDQVVGIANALAVSETAPKGETSKAHLFPATMYRFMVVEEFGAQARKVPDAVGSSCQPAFTTWRDRLAGLSAKAKSPKT